MDIYEQEIQQEEKFIKIKSEKLNDLKKEITVELKSVELKIVRANRLKSVQETEAES